MGRVTVSKIISECCEAIYQVLSEKYLQSLKSSEEWKTIAQNLKIHRIYRTSSAQLMGKMSKRHWKFISQLQGIVLALFY